MAIAAVAAVSMSMAASAQEKGDMAVGGNLAQGFGDGYSNLGIGAKFQYNVIKPVRLEGSFTYFFKNDLLNMWDMSVNGHYLFPVANKLTVYPLAGVSILNSRVDIPGFDFGELGSYGGGSASNSEFGVNFGGGIDFKLTDRLILNAETKYKIGDTWDRLILSAGIAYRF
jgi:outer membrane protein X